MDETAEELDRIIDALPAEQREHLKTLVYNLVTAFDPEQAHRQVLIIFNNEKDDALSIGTANMSAYEAAGLLIKLATLMEQRMMDDAPSKEMFN
jgi:hypothetical protein